MYEAFVRSGCDNLRCVPDRAFFLVEEDEDEEDWSNEASTGSENG
jgi:hypothetical protein